MVNYFIFNEQFMYSLCVSIYITTRFAAVDGCTQKNHITTAAMAVIGV